ncbi:probable RNA polymerase II nuclear localization protein SLC7A6OS [Penaeus japonicus]|uniref:probable RNA polymerase II nuclear localization protein SLC7A6OS n=1 Tax=Penaeus japonicus TaxID=27405 RepID=UPI001C70DDB0|nr:probable RNA polymerase II nuclear localization protein SLC7A6OS [Penaeus japonicus]
MATIIRIKRRHDEEPTENIIIKAKRSRLEESDEAAALCESSTESNHTIMTRVGTVNSKEDDVEQHVLKVMKDHKKGWELREQYKKLGNAQRVKAAVKEAVKNRVDSRRYKIVAACRGIEDKADKKENCQTEKQKDKDESETAQHMSTEEFKLYDALLPEVDTKDDVITCNGVPMETEKYVYDIYYTPQSVDWIENICEIEKHRIELYHGSDSEDEDNLQDDDDENDENNWRNDYPDESDDSHYSDEIDYLNAQIRKVTTKNYDTDESYDINDYEEDFDEDGNLIESGYPDSAMKFRREIREMLSGEESGSDSD